MFPLTASYVGEAAHTVVLLAYYAVIYISMHTSLFLYNILNCLDVLVSRFRSVLAYLDILIYKIMRYITEHMIQLYKNFKNFQFLISCSNIISIFFS